MAADYLISSLLPLEFDGAAPYTEARFLDLCRAQLSADQSAAIADALAGRLPDAPPSWAPAAQWRDLEIQLRNAVAAERARARGEDPSRWRRPAEGCALHWAGRVAAAFQERDPERRDHMLDQVRWDAAAELVPVASPLSAAAALAYAIRLAIVLRRRRISVADGNETFSRLTAASRPEF